MRTQSIHLPNDGNRFIKLQWRVAPAPTGRYRSFEKRGWPSATYHGCPIVNLHCDEAYHPRFREGGSPGPIVIFLADYSVEGCGFKWRKLVKRAYSLDEAIELAGKALAAHPHFIPN